MPHAMKKNAVLSTKATRSELTGTSTKATKTISASAKEVASAKVMKVPSVKAMKAYSMKANAISAMKVVSVPSMKAMKNMSTKSMKKVVPGKGVNVASSRPRNVVPTKAEIRSKALEKPIASRGLSEDGAASHEGAPDDPMYCKCLCCDKWKMADYDCLDPKRPFSRCQNCPNEFLCATCCADMGAPGWLSGGDGTRCLRCWTYYCLECTRHSRHYGKMSSCGTDMKVCFSDGEGSECFDD